MKEYPECEKLGKVNSEFVAIAQFLEHSGYHLCEWPDDSDVPRPVNKTITNILYEYLEIDADKLEAERSAMLAAL